MQRWQWLKWLWPQPGNDVLQLQPPKESLDVQQQLTALHFQLEAERAKTQRAIEAYKHTQKLFDEYQKRAEQRVATAYIRGVRAAGMPFLSVVDDLSQAFRHLPPELKGHIWVKGIFLTIEEFAKTLRKLGFIRFPDPKSPLPPFDPRYHEAIATEYRTDLEEGRIVFVRQAGYLFRTIKGDGENTKGESQGCEDHVLRPARVVVSTQDAPYKN